MTNSPTPSVVGQDQTLPVDVAPDEARVADPAGPTGDPAVGERWFRPDVDGLRALAILLVVGYHADLPFLPGGFVGVDVFFVISGYLITRNLLREVETTKRVELRSFWARRIRRLLPAQALVVLLTLIVGYQILPLYDLQGFAMQGIMASLYLSNMWFAVDAQDYFLAGSESSPFLHTWSLGVEEQFYVIWPVIFLLSAGARKLRLLNRLARARRRVLLAAFGLLFVSSFLLSLHLTNAGSTWAFFGLPSRAWEFAAAGLLAAVALPRSLRTTGARIVIGATGLIVLVVANLVIDGTTAYPGLWALLPVTATVLIIMAGDSWDGTMSSSPLSGVLAWTPMQWIGRVSYSWYLWHWPFIVLIPMALDRVDTPTKTAAALASLPVAWLSYRYFETPLRFAPVLARSTGRTYAIGVVLTLVMAGTGVFVHSVSPSLDTVAQSVPLNAEASLNDRMEAAVASFRAQRDERCPTQISENSRFCVGGAEASPTTVAIIGDSHALAWQGVFEQIGSSNGVRVVTRKHPSCPVVPVRTLDKNGALQPLCAEALIQDAGLIDDLRPKAVIVISRAGYLESIVDADGNALSVDDRLRLYEVEFEKLLRSYQAAGTRVGYFLDQPNLPSNPMQCLKVKQDVPSCELPRDEAMAKTVPIRAVEDRVIARVGNVSTFDVEALICDEARCHLQFEGGRLIYVDISHLTEEFALHQRPALEQFFQQLVR